MARNGAVVDLQPIDRLEEKVRLLVSMIDTLRAERSKTQDEAARLQRELDATRAQLGAAEGASTELVALRDERELMRTRVVEMISHIEKLNL
jgi:uncharacterized coiled-coil DUF342 family protein